MVRGGVEDPLTQQHERVVDRELGAIVLATINNGLVLVGVQEFYRLLFQGLAIVAAVAVDALVQKRVLTATRRRVILEVSA